MANTFVTAYTDLLDYINRPSSELLTQAKREINNALLWLQRKRPFKMTERLIRVTYPANALHINLSAACEGTLRNLLNVSMLATATDTVGKLLEITSYDLLMRERRQWQGDHEPLPEYQAINDPSTHSNYTDSIHKYRVFQVGENNIGLYPTPTIDVNLVIDLHIWLPELVATTDTNFFFIYAYDVLLLRALSRTNLYLKEDRRISVSQAELAESYEALIEWDASILSPINR